MSYSSHRQHEQHEKYEQQQRIIILGSLNTDLVTVTSRIPTGGETLTAQSFSTGPGGKGLNQAVACARAARTTAPAAGSASGSQDNDHSQQTHDIQVSMLGATGTSSDDQLSDALHQTLQEENINSSAIIRIPGISSGTATILVEQQTGENRILVVPGANGRIDQGFLENKAVRKKLWGAVDDSDADSQHLQKAALLVLQLEIPLETVVEVVAQAQKHNVPVLLNPAPAVPDIPLETLTAVDHLIVNETEAEILLSSHDPVPKDLETSSEEWLRHVFRSFAKLKVKQLIVTLGAQGACFTSSASEQGYEFVPAVKVPRDKVVDTTAAGDTFVGAYAVELVKSQEQQQGFDTRKAIERACKASALTIQKEGAVKSIPFGTEY